MKNDLLTLTEKKVCQFDSLDSNPFLLEFDNLTHQMSQFDSLSPVLKGWENGRIGQNYKPIGDILTLYDRIFS